MRPQNPSFGGVSGASLVGIWEGCACVVVVEAGELWEVTPEEVPVFTWSCAAKTGMAIADAKVNIANWRGNKIETFADLFMGLSLSVAVSKSPSAG